MKKTITLLLIFATSTIFSQVPNYVPTNGLVGWWPFTGNANDMSGNGNNGIVNGATLTTDRNGNTNSAYSFNGVNHFIQVQTPSLNNTISISFWAFDQGGYPNSNSLNPRYFSSEFCDGGFALVNNVNTPGGVFFTRNRGNTTAEMFGSFSPTYLTNQHIVFTYDGINGKFYLNGNLMNTVSNSGSISQSSNLFFGKSGCVFGQMIDAFNGKLDDIGIWNRALTQQEITNLYNASLSTEDFAINTIHIYPNPITSILNFKSLVAVETIAIYNMLGQLVQQEKVNALEGAINIEKLAQGTYLVKVNDIDKGYTIIKN